MTEKNKLLAKRQVKKKTSPPSPLAVPQPTHHEIASLAAQYWQPWGYLEVEEDILGHDRQTPAPGAFSLKCLSKVKAPDDPTDGAGQE